VSPFFSPQQHITHGKQKELFFQQFFFKLNLLQPLTTYWSALA
jgi:hypothetical protein